MNKFKHTLLILVFLLLTAFAANAAIPDFIQTLMQNGPAENKITFIAYFDNDSKILTENSFNNNDDGYQQLGTWGLFKTQPMKIDTVTETSAYYLLAADSDDEKAGQVIVDNINTLPQPVATTDNMIMSEDKFLAIPDDVTITPNELGLTISWSAITDANPDATITYNIYRRTNESEEIVYTKKDTVTDPTYTDGTADKEAVEYSYIIVATADDDVDGTIDRYSGHTDEDDATGSPLGTGGKVCTSISFSADSYTIKAGDTSAFVVEAIYDTGATNTITGIVETWKKDDEAIDIETGLTAAGGPYTVQAEYLGETASTQVTVVPAEINSVEVTADKTQVKPEETVNFSITEAKDAYGNDVTDYTYTETWTAGTTAGAQTVAVEVTDNYGTIKSKNIEITVTTGDLAVIEVSPEEAILMIGETIEFTVTKKDAHDNLIEEYTQDYTATQAGIDTVDFSEGNIEKIISITVIPQITDIIIEQNGSVTEDNLSLTVKGINSLGETVNLSQLESSLSYTDTDGKVLDNGLFNIAEKNDGAHTVYATLSILNKTFNAEATINVNLKAPDIKIVDKYNKEIGDGAVLSSKPELHIEITDASGIETDTVYIYLNDQKVKQSEISAINAADVGNNTITTYSIAYSAAEELAVGKYSIKIEADDIHGKPATYEVSGLQVYAGVQVIGTPLNYPNPFKPASGQLTTIKYTLANDAEVKLMIFDITGRMIYSELRASGTEGGQVNVNRVTWNGKNALGTTVPNGVYHFLLVNEGSVIGRGQIAVLD